MKKVLVLCQGGQVRSVTVAGILRYGYDDNKFDALAASLEKNSHETLNMLCMWADMIVVVEGKLMAKMPAEYLPKTRLFPIGPDVWRMSNHPDLIRRIYDLNLDDFINA